MKVTAPGAFSLEGIGAWARTLAASISQGWQVEHTPDGTHHFPRVSPVASDRNFGGSSSMTWTVATAGVRQWQYRMVGAVMEITFDISGTVAGAVSAQLLAQIPGGYTVSPLTKVGVFAFDDAGTTGTGSAEASGKNIQFYKSLAAPNWTAGTVRVAGTIRFEVQ